jgi:hypothetical protein
MPLSHSRRFLIGCVVVGCAGLVAGIALCLTPQSAKQQAAGAVEEQLPFRDLFSPSEVAEQFERRKIDQVPDPELACEINVPKSWELRSTKGAASPNDAKRLTPLATFSPENEGAIIELQYMRVPESVSVDRFLDTYAGTAGYRVLQRQHETFNRREVADALLAKDGDRLGAIYTRFTVTRRDQFVMVVASSAPKSSYEEYKLIFGLAALSFETPSR